MRLEIFYQDGSCLKNNWRMLSSMVVFNQTPLKDFAVMNASELSPYIDLMKSFLANKIDAHEFEDRYLSMFKEDTTDWTEEEYENLNYLFGEIDAFTPDPELRNENDIDEDQLREATKMTLTKLSMLS